MSWHSPTTLFKLRSSVSVHNVDDSRPHPTFVSAAPASLKARLHNPNRISAYLERSPSTTFGLLWGTFIKYTTLDVVRMRRMSITVSVDPKPQRSRHYPTVVFDDELTNQCFKQFESPSRNTASICFSGFVEEESEVMHYLTDLKSINTKYCASVIHCYTP